MSAGQGRAAELVHEGFQLCQAPASPAAPGPQNVSGQRHDQETRSLWSSALRCSCRSLSTCCAVQSCLSGHPSGGMHEALRVSPCQPGRLPPAREDPQPRAPRPAWPHRWALSASPLPQRLGWGSITDFSFFFS